MKVAFLTHTTRYGGAAISQRTVLEYLFENYLVDPTDCILAIPHGEPLGVYSSIASRMNTVSWQLPFSLVFKGAPDNIRIRVSSLYKEIRAIIGTIRYNTVLKREGVTHIHLNSSVFWCMLPFLPKQMKKIIHIRELMKDTLAAKLAIWTINRYADTILAISQQTAQPFPRAIIIENPYDMRRARQCRNIRDALKRQFDVPPDVFVVSVIAEVSEGKGHRFLEEVLQQLGGRKDILVISAGAVASVDLFNSLTRYKQFRYLGERESVDELYAISDVILRCEQYLPLGRTVYEGIYAGCTIAVPLSRWDDTHEILPYLGEQIFVYAGGNAGSCLECLDRIRIRNYEQGNSSGFKEMSNVKQSALKFMEVLC